MNDFKHKIVIEIWVNFSPVVWMLKHSNVLSDKFFFQLDFGLNLLDNKTSKHLKLFCRNPNIVAHETFHNYEATE